MAYFPATQFGAIQWDKALIDKYDTRGPRYTSYPTAAQFVPFSAEDYSRCLTQVKARALEPLSLYVHIPFCQDICYYCACNKVVTRKTDMAETYLGYLEKEMALIHQQIGDKRKVTQLHLGGGTPTFLTAGQLTRLVHSLSRYFQLTESATREYSIEIDPRTVSRDTLALLKGLGFNRISFGIQDFSPDVQQAINRINSFKMVSGLVSAARDYGFAAINFDLIYGLPKQTLENMQHTLEQVIELKPARIAFYNYAHLPDRFSSQRAIDRMTLPSAEQKLDMLNMISRMLTDAGYLYIGMDHFVLPDDELAIAQQHGRLQRNFQGYSTARAHDLIGLGMSSITCCHGFFAQNHKQLDQYYAALDAGMLATEKGLEVNEDDLKRRGAIMPLISNLKLSFKEWNRQFNDDFIHYFAEELEKLQPMQADRLLEITATGIEVLPAGRAMIRNICMAFDAYHDADSGRFSKVI